MTVYYPFVDIYDGEPYYGTGQSNDAHGKDSTVTLTKDDATLTANSDDWSSKVSAGAAIYVDYATSKTPLFVSSVTDATNLEMTSVWPNTTASGLNYFIDAPNSTTDYRLRIFPQMRQHSGKTGSLKIEIPFESQTSIMPLQATKSGYHVDGWIYIDSCNKSGVNTVGDLLDAIETMSNDSGILGMRWYDKNLGGGSSAGVIIDSWTIKDKLPSRSYDSDSWKAKIQMDLQPGVEL